MRAVPCVLLFACLIVGSAGCQSANKRQSGGDNSPFTSTGGKKKSEVRDPIFDSSGADADLGGMLAGQVLDGVTGLPVDANIRWVCLDEKEEERDIRVDAKPRGYFTIQGLKPGKHYKLMAEAKTGERKLAGVAYSSAPNPRVVIKVKDDLVSPNSQPSPPAPAPPNPKKKDDKSADPLEKTGAAAKDRPAVAQAPGWEVTVPPVAVPQPGGQHQPAIRPPVPLAPGDGPWATGQIPPPPPPPPPDPSRIADVAQNKPPTMWVRPPETGERAPTPSCVLLGKQLVNFSLHDLNGQPWEYKTSRRGRMVLLDFWGTNCLPCLHAIPHLRIFKERYGPAGLDVVAVAYEQAADPAEQAKRVRSAAERHYINYTLLLGGGANCPVRTQFAVTRLPTLVLIAENGAILWRHEGRMDRQHLDDLDGTIRHWLGTR